MYGSSVWNWLTICIQEHYARCHLHSTEITPNFYRNKEPCSAKNIIINSLWFTWRTRFTSHESRKRINIFITEEEGEKRKEGRRKRCIEKGRNGVFSLWHRIWIIIDKNWLTFFLNMLLNTLKEILYYAFFLIFLYIVTLWNHIYIARKRYYTRR